MITDGPLMFNELIQGLFSPPIRSLNFWFFFFRQEGLRSIEPSGAHATDNASELSDWNRPANSTSTILAHQSLWAVGGGRVCTLRPSWRSMGVISRKRSTNPRVEDGARSSMGEGLGGTGDLGAPAPPLSPKVNAPSSGVVQEIYKDPLAVQET